MRLILCILITIFFASACSNMTLKHKKRLINKWDVLVLDFKGPELTEQSEDHPFLNYRLIVDFKSKTRSYKVEGYFAADGNAAETSADKGNIWRVKFRPDEIGEWSYSVSFKKGKDIIYADDLNRADFQALPSNGEIGYFEVLEGGFKAPDLRAKGRLLKSKKGNYQQFAESKEYFIKGGAGSPENFLAFADFDATYSLDSSKNFIKSYTPHLNDWKVGDPVWQKEKGKGIIGALNYLSSKGMNSIYFLTFNIEGDGKDVWMYNSPNDFTRFDVSKLDQWEIVFQHAQNLGIVLHIITQETENELLLDGGKLGKNRKLYYRELIARFGHHLAIIWNMGEENGPANFSPNGQTTEDRIAMFRYFQKHNSQNLVALHTHAAANYKDEILNPILGNPSLDALSLQIDQPSSVYEQIRKWKNKSQKSGHPWLMYFDEAGPYWKGILPDAFDMEHDTVRQELLWGSLMAGCAGVEWYFGYKYPQADLNCEDWRSRDSMWDQTKYAMDFFNKYIPFWEMKPMDGLMSNSAKVLAKPGLVYAIYQKTPDPNAILNEKKLNGKKMSISWYNPRKGGDLLNEKYLQISDQVKLGLPPNELNRDWVALVKIIE